MIPFIVGALAGVAVVVAVKKRKEIKHVLTQGATDVQETVSDASKSIKKKVHEMTAEEETKKVVAKKPVARKPVAKKTTTTTATKAKA